MATYYKRSTVTTLGSLSSWSTTGPTGTAAATLPTSLDQVQWDTASLGGALTGNLSAYTLQLNGATANITHSSGILNFYSVNMPSSTLTFSSSGTLNMEGGSWNFYGGYSPTGTGANLSLTGVLNAGNSTTISRSSGSSWATFRYTPPSNSTPRLKLILGDYSCFKFINTDNTVNFTSDSYIRIDSITARISSETPSGIFSICWLYCPIIINSNTDLGNIPINMNIQLEHSITFNSGGPYNINIANQNLYNVNFSSGSGNNSISGYGSLYGTTALGNDSIVFSPSSNNRIDVSGGITGTNGLTKSGLGELYIPYDLNNTLTGVININDGILTVTGSGIPTVSSFNIGDTGILNIASNTYLPTISGSGNVIFSYIGSVNVPNGYFLNSQNASLGYGVGSFYSGSTYNINIQEFPSKLLYYIENGRGDVTWNSASYINYSGDINIYLYNNGSTSSLINNQANSSHTVTISSQINIAQSSRANTSHTINFGGSNTGNNTVSSVIPSGGVGRTISLSKEGAGKWIVSGSNNFTGSVTLTAGTLTCTNSNSLGSSTSSGTTTLTAGTLQLSGDITINRSLSPFTYNGAAVQSLDGVNSIFGSSHTLNANTSFNISSGSLSLSGAIAGSSTYGLTKSGSGDLTLVSTTSGYLGTTTISSGRLAIYSIQNPALSSSIGAPATAQATITMASNTTLAFIGSSFSSTTRNISSTAASGSKCTLENSGTAAVVYASGGTFQFMIVGTPTLELSGSCTTESTFGRTLADPAIQNGVAASLLKSGSGSWLMSGNMIATGSITVTGGDFRITGTTTISHNVSCGGNSVNFGSTNRTFASLTVSSGTVSITAGNTISAPTTISGGTITAVLTGAKTLTISSGATEDSPATIQPNDTTNGNNTLTGSVSINGCVDLVTSSAITPLTSGRGRTLGTSNTVTVSSNGIIRTKTGPATSQRGQARYNNLTFQSGSAIKIGKAA